MLKAVVIYIFYYVWEVRNWARFENHSSDVRVSIRKICDQIHLTGKFTMLSSSSYMDDFCIFKVFNIKMRPPDAPHIIELFLEASFFWLDEV